MNREIQKLVLTNFIDANRPPVLTKGTFFIVFRQTNLLIVGANKLRRGDIRLLTCLAEDLVKGLSDGQWSELLEKYATLFGIVEHAINNN